ncbi:hypothetical protein E3_0200 [Rhodococcus phage E3]|uniref:hypothetical protein n=1 Tax=Rhodococcus phage E3 TaxID=1007869 RepID=UPI0002C6C0B7|nr:hypothetical protein M176_gp021 [Rhodococcus phage E3]AEQ20931.1 hypothetical protein E3_0200 [Rhodococcus phage E3]
MSSYAKLRNAAQKKTNPYPPAESPYGVLRWSVQLSSPGFAGQGHVNIDSDGRLSLTGIPWTLSVEDSEVVARELANAVAWVKANR